MCKLKQFIFKHTINDVMILIIIQHNILKKVCLFTFASAISYKIENTKNNNLMDICNDYCA